MAWSMEFRVNGKITSKGTRGCLRADGHQEIISFLFRHDFVTLFFQSMVQQRLWWTWSHLICYWQDPL